MNSASLFCRTHTLKCLSLYSFLNRNDSQNFLDLYTLQLINRVKYQVRPMPEGVVKMLNHLDDDTYNMDRRVRAPPQMPLSAPVNLKSRRTKDDGCQDDDQRPRNKRLRAYTSLICLATMSMAQGVKKHGSKAIYVIYNELLQLHRESWKVVFPDELSKEDWKDVFPSYLLLTEKVTTQPGNIRTTVGEASSKQKIPALVNTRRHHVRCCIHGFSIRNEHDGSARG